MTLKEQLNTIKNNWLIVAVFLVFILGIGFFIIEGTSFSTTASRASFDSVAMAEYDRYQPVGSLAPEVVERIILKSATLRTKVEEFEPAQQRLDTIVQNHNIIITTEAVTTAHDKYKTGRYTLNVPINQYDSAVARLKEIGIIDSFSETSRDITGTYITQNDVLEAEKAKLKRYEDIYAEAENVDEKLRLVDRINNQERTIRALENRIANTDDRIDYSQIQLTITQNRPMHPDVRFANIQDLWSAFKQSLNTLIMLLAYIAPFAILYGLYRLIKFMVKKYLF